MTDATPLASEQITPETFLAQLRRVNTDRYQAWIGDADDAGILFDATELGGEVGELLNVVKKLEREARGWRGSRAAPEDFADECADVLICLDKLARRMDVDLEAATIRKFNATSDKVGLPQRLSATPAPSDQDASQAQGEVAKALAAARDFIMSQDNSTGCCMCGSPVDSHGYGDGHSPVDEGSYHAMQIVQQIDAALSPAPGATAQDGVDWAAVGREYAAKALSGGIPQVRAPQYALSGTLTAMAQEIERLRATPTPTIPAGMVAYNGKGKPDDWDGGPVQWGNNEAQFYSELRTDATLWLPAEQRPHLMATIIAYTPLAAAPKQAEQQGVERARALWQQACVGREGYCSSDLQDAAITAIGNAFREAEAAARSATLPAHFQWSEGNREKFDFGRDSAADAIAALNAPTGAVEKERL